jgi:hypothetical protein
MNSGVRRADVSVYVISCRLGVAKIGVASDAQKRLRELQVGSPVELKLALSWRFAERREAEAVAAELYRCFAGRRAGGRWYRLTAAEVRQALGTRTTLEAAAAARTQAAAEASAREGWVARRRAEKAPATEKQLAYERRRQEERAEKQERAAKLLGQGMTQQAAAAEVGVTSRTLRNWKASPAFRRERERRRKRAARQRAAPYSKFKPRARRDAENNRRTAGGRPAAQPQPDRPPTPAGQQETIAETGEQPPSGFRSVDGVPLWGDSDGPVQSTSTPSATPTTRLAATDRTPTASTTTPSSASAAKPRPKSAPFAVKKRETATAGTKRTSTRDRQGGPPRPPLAGCRSSNRT